MQFFQPDILYCPYVCPRVLNDEEKSNRFTGTRDKDEKFPLDVVVFKKFNLPKF